MSKESVKEFYIRLAQDKELQSKLVQDKGSMSSDECKQDVINTAKAAGYNFTTTELDEFLSGLTIESADQIITSEVDSKGRYCYCFLGGGGNPGDGGKVCACVFGGGGSNDNGECRCCCISAGTGN